MLRRQFPQCAFQARAPLKKPLRKKALTKYLWTPDLNGVNLDAQCVFTLAEKPLVQEKE